MNKFNGYGEYSSMLVCACLIGASAEPMSHRPRTFALKEAMDLRKRRLRGESKENQEEENNDEEQEDVGDVAIRKHQGNDGSGNRVGEAADASNGQGVICPTMIDGKPEFVTITRA